MRYSMVYGTFEASCRSASVEPGHARPPSPLSPIYTRRLCETVTSSRQIDSRVCQPADTAPSTRASHPVHPAAGRGTIIEAKTGSACLPDDREQGPAAWTGSCRYGYPPSL
ncbi:hypothetical protein LZ30DRAFT_716445 [Colletotrichum cereale]|nr:hypothetical protein LZ30DRAFT_716445 [Colletotrichum cereale]